jgi:hypothetical protein
MYGNISAVRLKAYSAARGVGVQKIHTLAHCTRYAFGQSSELSVLIKNSVCLERRFIYVIKAYIRLVQFGFYLEIGIYQGNISHFCTAFRL